MPRAHRTGSTAAQTTAKAPAKKRTIAANDEAARDLAARRKLACEAAQCAFANSVGSKKALKQDDFKDRGVTYNMVEPLLVELKAGGTKKRMDAPRDHPKQILTNQERRDLAEWMLCCAAGQEPKDRAAVSAKVKEMLRARHASNKRRSWTGGSIKLKCVGSCRARGRAGSGARCVGPRRASARSGSVWPPASPCCWATTLQCCREGPECGQGCAHAARSYLGAGSREIARDLMHYVGHKSVYKGDCGDQGVG